MMKKEIQHIRIEDYTYDLPDERIAKFPLDKRDESKLLLYRNGEVSETIFRELPSYLPESSLLVFNNTRVIRARLLFNKSTGARIEVFCLEPVEPNDYALVFQQNRSCVWKCLIGNLKKWKEGPLERVFSINGEQITLQATHLENHGDTHTVRFTWDNASFTFADLIEEAGILPIPPYLHRETVDSDLKTYQTVYSKIKGSVAAPTAGLHFTPEVLADLDRKGFGRAELTLHVGAGTFKPVKSETIEGHEMHTEYIAVPYEIIKRIKDKAGRVIAVGTTSVRTIESLYYIGVLLEAHPEVSADELVINQWMPYKEANNTLPVDKSLQNILDYLERNQSDTLITATQIMIAPGYIFKIVKGIITNFHQPQSTLLLLISAFVEGDWKKIYNYALDNNFRFLSYGDSSLLL